MIIISFLLFLFSSSECGDFFEECIRLFNSKSGVSAAKYFKCAQDLYIEQADIKTSAYLAQKAFALMVEDKKYDQSVQPLKFMVNNLNISPHYVYSLCSELKQIDCSYFKAKILEDQGQVGSALDLYVRSGAYSESIRISALLGEDFNVLLKKFSNDNSVRRYEKYYKGIYAISRGEWNNSLHNFSQFTPDRLVPTYFYIGYANVMLGNIAVAESLASPCNTCSIYEKLDKIRLEGLVLYAKNNLSEAIQKFFAVLRYYPTDFFSKLFVSQIYYRMGWFEKAEELFSNLIGREWRDTELFYLLKERAEMRLRSKRFDLARNDADKILKEYPDRTDFYVDWIVWNLNYNEGRDLDFLLERLKNRKDNYSKSLYEYVLGLVREFQMRDVEALEHFKNAEGIFSSSVYRNKISAALRNLYKSDMRGYNFPVCSDYKVYEYPNGKWFVESYKFGEEFPIKYFVEKKGDLFQVSLYLSFYSESWNNYTPYTNDWIKDAERIWSVHGLKLKIYATKSDIPWSDVKIRIQSWPSALFLSRISSHSWSLLSSPRTVAHEMGHLLGIDDEYFETDADILSRNIDRFIGPRTSIMRNILSGQPEKRHIQSILYPIKCPHVDVREGGI